MISTSFVSFKRNSLTYLNVSEETHFVQNKIHFKTKQNTFTNTFKMFMCQRSAK